MRRELAQFIFAIALFISSGVGADDGGLDVEKKQLSDHLISLGPLSPIQDQMTRNGRTDAELRSALIQAFESLASCIVDAVVAQANQQNLPATPVLRMMIGIYNGPEDVESVDEIETIRSFDFDAIKGARMTCNEKFMDDIG